MKIQLLIFLFLLGAVCISAVLLQQIRSEQLDKQTLKQQVNDLRSYNSEAALLIDQYLQDKTSITYVRGQAEHLNEKVLAFYGEIEGKEVPNSLHSKLKNIEKIVFNLSLKLKTLQSSHGDKTTLQQIKQDLHDVSRQLKEVDTSL